MQSVDAGIDEQNHGKGQNVPEALLGEKRQEIGPQSANESPQCNGKDNARKKTPSDESWRGAAAGGDLEKSRDGQDGEGVAERGLDKQRDFHLAPQIHLLENGKKNRAADATEGSSRKERGNPGEMERVAADERDTRRAKREAENGKKETAREMAENFAELEFEAAFEKYKNERERAKAVRGAAEKLGVDPMQRGPDEHSRGHQDDDVGNSGEAHQSVGDEGENKQTAEQRKKEIQVHGGVRRARGGEIVAEMRS